MKFTLSFFMLLVVFIVSENSQAQNISTIAGSDTVGYTGDHGPATAARLNAPVDVTTDTHGNVYIADAFNHAVRKISPAGIITTIAGNGTQGFTGDGGPATNATMNYPWSVTLDAAGDLFIADEQNNRIRRVDTNGIITTIIGSADTSLSGDGGPASAATLCFPNHIRFDAAGNMYITDFGHSRIRKVDMSGNIHTIVGDGSSIASGDGGPATAAGIKPFGFDFDSDGNMYICDYDNNKIRKVDTAGIITTIGGTGAPGYSGDGGLATMAAFDQPGRLLVDRHNNVVICDIDNSVLRKIDMTGVVTKVAGTTMGFSGDGGPATDAQLNWPNGIALDNNGYVYICDESNDRIRKFLYDPTEAVTSVKHAIAVTTYPNPVRDVLYIENISLKTHYQLTDVKGSVIQEGILNQPGGVISAKSLISGIYTLNLFDDEGGSAVTKVIKE